MDQQFGDCERGEQEVPAGVQVELSRDEGTVPISRMPLAA